MSKERKVLILDNTTYETYATCPTKYFYRMQRNLRPDVEAQYFAFGKALHVMMHKYLEEDRDIDKAIDSLMTIEQRDFDVLVGTDDYRSLRRAGEVMLDYHARFQNEKMSVYEVGGSKVLEKSFAFPLESYETETAIWDIIYCGRIDGIMKIGDTPFVIDHKTTSSKKSTWASKFDYPSNQMTGYVVGASVILGKKINHVMINLFHVTKTKTDFDRAFLYIAPYQVEEWIKKIHDTAYRMIDDVEANEYDMFTTGCYGMYGRCMFHQICSSPPELRESIIEMDYIVDPWNPLDDGEGEEE